MKYVADDGTEFKTEKECLEYESYVADIESSFIMYGSKFNKLSPKDYEYCRYVNVLGRATEVGEFLYKQYGLGVYRNTIVKEGIYIYDDGNFKSIRELFNYHCEEAQRFREIEQQLWLSFRESD